jgi:hypothetical protein
MKDKFIPLIILVIFGLGAWWMIDGMSNVVKMTQPNAKSIAK